LCPHENVSERSVSLNMKKALAILLLAVMLACLLSSFPTITEARPSGVGSIDRSVDVSELKQMTLAKGMNINAWSSDAYSSSDFGKSMKNLRNLGANWVSISVFEFMQTKNSNNISPISNTTWPATASFPSLRHAIKEAKSLGMKVSLRPIIDVLDGTWRGKIQPENWTKWFINYQAIIHKYAVLSQEENVNLFVVGTEIASSQPYTTEWETIISDTRVYFHGPITYAANWNQVNPYGVDDLTFWDKLDYIGVDAYYPLTNSNCNPTVDDLKNGWSSWTGKLEQLHQASGKEIFFNEIGYKSVNGTNFQPSNWRFLGKIDLDEQARCYQATLQVFQNQSWFKGWFWWTWEVNPNAGGPSDRGYTPQGKPAENILKNYYQSS
jgi:hypothetical protein